MESSRQLRGKRAVVVGLGKSGLAAARLLLREGASVIGVDDRSETELGPVVAELRSKGVRLELQGSMNQTSDADIAVKSPGVKPTHPIVVDLKSKGVSIIGEVELCVPWLKRPVVAITGTNGKSTTTALTGHLLQSSGRKVFVGGNLGTPVAEQVLSGMEVEASVLELSSYQIDDLQTFQCDVAAVLNVTPDHLERYGTIENYAASKERLLTMVAPSGIAILNADDSHTRVMGSRSRARVVDFGHGQPKPGAIRESNGVITRKSGDKDESYRVTATALRGSHNLENAMAAIEAARSLGASPESVQHGLATYAGLPHRIEFIRRVNGVEWINDSKATNVDSVEKSLAAFAGPLHIIMGGRGKGAPYAPLRPLFKNRVARLYVIGEDAGRIAEELGDLAPVEKCGDLETAVRLASKMSKPGDTVLLAPACASFDQFRGFEHRGQVFRELVENLPEVRK